MTLELYKEKYIYKEEKNEEGVFVIIDKNNFKNDNEVFRYLGEISLKLL